MISKQTDGIGHRLEPDLFKTVRPNSGVRTPMIKRPASG